MRLAKSVAILLALALTVGSAVLFGGLVNPAADEPHSRAVHLVMDALRHRGIDRRARGIDIPDLADPTLARAGAGNYAAMCAGCHLEPGVSESELHRGLYPQPPVLAEVAGPATPGHVFWTIKHGIKASGMPAWGKSMDDRSIWGLVAFLQQLPRLTPEAYRAAVENSGGHTHGPAGAADSSSHQDEDGHDHDHEHTSHRHDEHGEH